MAQAGGQWPWVLSHSIQDFCSGYGVCLLHNPAGIWIHRYDRNMFIYLFILGTSSSFLLVRMFGWLHLMLWCLVSCDAQSWSWTSTWTTPTHLIRRPWWDEVKVLYSRWENTSMSSEVQEVPVDKLNTDSQDRRERQTGGVVLVHAAWSSAKCKPVHFAFRKEHFVLLKQGLETVKL